MPLWVVALRSLAYRQAVRTHIRRPQSHTGWIQSQHRARSSSTALPQNQPDDSVTSPLSSPLSDVDDYKPFGGVLESHTGLIAPKQQKPPEKRQGRKRRLRQPSKKKQQQQQQRQRSVEPGTPRTSLVRSHHSRSVLSQRRRLWKMWYWGSAGATSRAKRRDAASKRISTRKTAPRLGQRALTQSIARFRGPDGELTTRRTTRGRIWSTANPYSLARNYPFNALPETTGKRWTYWERQYAYIAWFYATYRSSSRKQGERPGVPLFKPRATEWVDAVLERLDTGETTITAETMHCNDVDEWRECWEQVALWLLTYRPARMIEFLLATNAQRDVEAHVFEDSLLQLARIFKHTKDVGPIRDLTNAFCHMVEERPDRSLNLHNEFIRLLQTHSDDHQKERLFNVLRTHEVKLDPYSWLHFTAYFANTNQFDAALEALLLARASGARLDGYAFRSCCTTILRKSSEQPDSLRVCLRLVSTLVDIGVTFNLPICNVIMLNAVEAGDLRTAFSVYHSLMERGLKPDDITFLVLLKGCRMNIDDAQLLDEIIRDAIGHLNIRSSPKVATAILQCLALHHSKHNPAAALNTLTEAYVQLFDVEPLKDLGLPISDAVESRIPAGVTTMPPTRHALTFMIGASIQQHLLTAVTPGAHTRQILDIYARWRAHVENPNNNANPILASLATTDHVPNLFLAAFIQNSKTLLLAARVVRDLQRPLPPTAITTQTKPSVQTWSLFLQGFTRHNQMKLAEQVLTYVRKEGLEPDMGTYNPLVKGYANAQDADGVVEVLRRAEAEGLVWDVWTYKGLRRLRDRSKLEEEFRQRRTVEQLDFSGDIKVGLGERLGGEHAVERAGEVTDTRVAEFQDSSEGVREWPKASGGQGFGDSPGEIAEHEVSVAQGYRPFGL